jgi:outer membrane protein assembly factor BamB
MIGSTSRILGSLAGVLTFAALAGAADWPQWLGPNHNGSSPETGLLTTWPKEGPKLLWKVPGGDGYSSIAVAGNRAYTMVQRGKDELVVCLDVANGKEIWARRAAPAYKDKMGDGPRSTPAVEGGRVFAQSATGPLVCLDAEKGTVIWEHDLLKEFKAKNISWGLSASPLIEGDLVLAIPGATGAGVAAFQKDSGKLAWKAGSDKAAYASPVVVTVDGTRQAIFFTASELLAVDAKSGQELWQVPWATEYDCNICTPLALGDQLFVSSGEKVGCALFKLAAKGKPTTVWESKGPKSVLMTYWANAVPFEKHLYGLTGEYDSIASLTCVDQATGKPTWKKDRFGLASVTLADGYLWITTPKGDLVLVAATPKEYQEKGRVKVMEESRYASVPTIAGKKLFLRDRKDIYCLDIAGK